MTENEAIKLGKSLYENITKGANNIIPTKEYIEFVETAIQALEKVQAFESIGTIEEFKALKEKFENAKDDIRKLLSSEYGSSCQFCVHDENEDAMCCNIGGSGSWCCENARWKEH